MYVLCHVCNILLDQFSIDPLVLSLQIKTNTTCVFRQSNSIYRRQVDELTTGTCTYTCACAQFRTIYLFLGV